MRSHAIVRFVVAGPLMIVLVSVKSTSIRYQFADKRKGNYIHFNTFSDPAEIMATE